MPRNGSGTYTLPEAPFVPSTTISSSAVNSDLSDIAVALTGSLAADGQTPLTGKLKFPNGSEALPSITFATDTSDGFWHVTGSVITSCGGVNVFSVQAPGVGVGAGLLGYGGNTTLIPIGIISDQAGGTVPSGWALCYGQAILRASYPELWSTIGSTWGSGNGSTTFNLPDLRGRATFGQDNMGGSAANRITNAASGIVGTTVGAVGGEQTHVLVTGELAAHSHTGSVSITDPGHFHIEGVVTAAGAFTNVPTRTATASLVYGTTPTSTETTGITATLSTDNTGSGTAHQNMPPAGIVQKIIFLGRA